MSVNWLKWSKGLAKKREVQVLASHFKRDRREIAGRLMEFWEWCDDNLDDVDFEGEDAIVSLGSRDSAIRIIDEQVGIDGMAEALELRGVDWIELGDGSAVRFKRFKRHNGNTAKARASDQRKKAIQRFKAADDCPGSRGTCPDSVPVKKMPEKSRVEKIRTTVATTVARNGERGTGERGPEGNSGDSNSDPARAMRPGPQRNFQGQPVPRGFRDRLDAIVSTLDLAELTDEWIDQVGFLATIAYADACGFQWPPDKQGAERDLWTLVNAAKVARRRRRNPNRNSAGYLTRLLKDDLGPERWAEFQASYPNGAHCQWLLQQLDEGKIQELPA